jgi:hypothetical protein
MGRLALGLQLQRTPTARHFVRLSTRTLEKCRYEGPAILEIVLNPDGPLWVVIADLARTSGFNEALDRVRTTAEMTHFGIETGFAIIGGNCRSGLADAMASRPTKSCSSSAAQTSLP